MLKSLVRIAGIALALSACMVQGPATAEVDEEVTFAYAFTAPTVIPEATFACIEFPPQFGFSKAPTYAVETAAGFTEGTAPLAPWFSVAAAGSAVTTASATLCYSLPVDVLSGVYSFTITAPSEQGDHVFFFSTSITNVPIPDQHIFHAPVGRRLAVPGPAQALDVWQPAEKSEPPAFVMAFANNRFYAINGLSVYTSTTVEDFAYAFSSPVEWPHGLVSGGGQLAFWGMDPTNNTTRVVLGNNEHFEPVISGGDPLAIQYGNHKFVALYQDMLAAFSTAATWSAYRVKDASLEQLAFGRGRFVAAADAADGIRIYTSVDGNQWQYTTPVTGTSVHNLVYAMGLFLLVDEQLNHYLSNDGYTWNKVDRVLDLPAYANLDFSIALAEYGGTQFASLHGFFYQFLHGAVRISFDGIHWETYFSGIAIPLPLVGGNGILATISEDLSQGYLPSYAAVLPIVPDTQFHDFGEVPLENEAVKVIQFENTTDAPVVLGTASIDKPFVIASDACSGTTLNAGEKCAVQVSLTPAAEGAVGGLIRLSTATPLRSNIAVRMEAVGTTAVEAPNAAPEAPVLVSPGNKATVPHPNVQLIWKESTDPDGEAVTYDVYICEAEDFGGCSAAKTDIASLVLPGGAMLGGIFLFGFALRRRPAKALILTALLTLGAVGCSAEGKDAIRKVLDIDNGIRTLNPGERDYIARELTPGATYYWKVVAKDGLGGESTSEVRSFTVSTQ